MSLSAMQIVPAGNNPLQFTPPAQLASGTVGTAYRYQFAVSGGIAPYSFAMTQGSLPPGIQLASTGLFAGTPTSAGMFSFTVEVCDSSTPQPQCLTGSTTVAINNPPAPPLQILTTSLPNAIKGVAYDVLLRGSGGVPPYKWSSPSLLPPGLQLTSAGEIKGTPTQLGTFTLNISLTDSQGTTPATAKLSLTITQASPPVITTTTLPTGTVSKAYPATQLQVSGGQSPYTWTLTAGSLPAGLRMSTAGAISGTPTSTGSMKAKAYAFTVQVTDANGQRAMANLSITINAVTGSGPVGLSVKPK
jgi:hypothetical protein